MKKVEYAEKEIGMQNIEKQIFSNTNEIDKNF